MNYSNENSTLYYSLIFISKNDRTTYKPGANRNKKSINPSRPRYRQSVTGGTYE